MELPDFRPGEQFSCAMCWPFALVLVYPKGWLERTLGLCVFMYVFGSHWSEVDGLCTTENASYMSPNITELYWRIIGQPYCRSTAQDSISAGLLRNRVLMLKRVGILSGPRAYCHSLGSGLQISEVNVVPRAWRWAGLHQALAGYTIALPYGPVCLLIAEIYTTLESS